ncbi:MAG: mycofactocin-associated electron transfer flavoprotein beta subunit [Ilumatobacteraceae bacterium]
MIVVARKWPTGDVGDERWSAVSESDRAALEVGLRLAEASGDSVTVVTVGGSGADPSLREALAVGAVRAVRIDSSADLRSDAVAWAIAEVARDARWVVCGDASSDRGSGAVPAFLAAELGAAQALGLVTVEADRGDGGDGETVRAVRRLDGGRREVLSVAAPAVLSVEGSVARLRRAALTAKVGTRTMPIEVLAGPSGPLDEPAAVVAYRPRPRAMPVPAGDALARVRTLTDLAGGPVGHGEVVTLDPPAAAAKILATLTTWGYR